MSQRPNSRAHGNSWRAGRVAYLIAGALVLACGKGDHRGPGGVDATISVDTAARFQVMTGWEATAEMGQEEAGFAGWQTQVTDLAVNDLGSNRIRLEVRSGAENPVDNYALYRAGKANLNVIRYTAANDNDDPNVINSAAFHFTELDQSVELIVLPLKQRLAAKGEQLYVNLNYVSFNSGGVIHGNPAEYAEFILATFQHLRDCYHLVPDAVEVILEPDNGTIWDGASVGAAIVAAGQRLAAADFHPEFIGPSVMNMANTVPFLDAMLQVPGVRSYLKEVSYHRYRGVSDANLAAIKSRASQYGVRTAMLEKIGGDVEDLYKDLTIANVSAWQQFTLAFPTKDNGAQYYVIANGVPVPGSRTRALQQYFRYVRIGATRVGAVSTDSERVRPVAFTNVGGAPVVVLHASGEGTFAISGLRAGTYRVTTSDPTTAALPDATTAADGTLRISAPREAIITVFPRA